MPNGFGLKGHHSSAQGILIVEDPGDTNKYYIFTIAQLAGADGLRYSIVDMRLEGGNGDITQKNVFVRNNLTEKITGIIRCDRNVWILTHEWQSNKFFADLLTSTGLNSPVISNSGSVHSGGGNGIKNTIGHMKISPNGDRLALAIRDMGQFDVFDFDINTGIVSNPISLQSSSYSGSYGVEFSSDGTKLYTNNHAGNLYQFDLSYTTASAMMANAHNFSSADLFGSMQRGPDGKIYVARNNSSDAGISFLGVINSPNTLGSGCNYVDNGISLGSKKSRWGLPNTMEVLESLKLYGDTVMCRGDTVSLHAIGNGNVQWLSGVTSTLRSIRVSPKVTTEYRAVLQNSLCNDTLSITVHVDSVYSPKITASDTIICPGDSVTLNVQGLGNATAQWAGGNLSSSQTQVTVFPSASTTYYVSALGAPCSEVDSIQIIMASPSLQANFITHVSPCGLVVEFESTNQGADSYEWEFGDGTIGTGRTVLHQYLSGGVYSVSLTIKNTRCNLSSTVNTAVSVPDTSQPPKIVFPDKGECGGGTFVFALSNDLQHYIYNWSFGNGESSTAGKPKVTYNSIGSYQVTVSIMDTLCGSYFSDTALVEIDQLNTDVHIPNCFTPNGDGLNELFMISGGNCGEKDVLEIYNRWGSRLFRTENPYDEFWDGTFKGRECSQGVYYYLLLTNNSVQRGHISLIR